MESSGRNGPVWQGVLITVVMLACAFAVPLVGPLRSYDGRVAVAVAVFLVAAAAALFVDSVDSRANKAAEKSTEESQAPTYDARGSGQTSLD